MVGDSGVLHQWPARSGRPPCAGGGTIGAASPDRAASRLSRAAATTASSVSASTDYLLAGDNVGAGKTNKADKLGVTVVSQDELWAWLAQAGVA